MKIVITGAAGRIAYSLIPLILRGGVFGECVSIDLVLLDIPEVEDKLRGVGLEIGDSNYPLLNSLLLSTNADEAFQGAEVAILLGGFPRLPGMERRDLLRKNAECIKAQAVALNRSADREVRVVVIANPANTNCLVAIKSAPDLRSSNFTCLTRLDEERLRNFCMKQVTEKELSLTTSVGAEVKDVYIFGNHSNTQVAYIGAGKVHTTDNQIWDIAPYFTEEEFNTLLKRVQGRGAEIIKHLQMSSAMSAAEATVKHLRDWLGPEIPTSGFSMGILTRGGCHYGVEPELVYSLPCVRSPDATSGYAVRLDLTLPPHIQELLQISIEELMQEKRDVEDYLA